MKRKIYLASSWRNENQPALVEELRAFGHEVYDFRNPAPGNTGFSWRALDLDWQRWTPERYLARVTASRVAAAGFALDKAALDWCDTCVLLLPCGRSAHLEAGYAAGQGKRVLVLLSAERFEPELMYLLCDGIVTSPRDLFAALDAPQPRFDSPTVRA